LDSGSTWSVSTLLPGSGASERWQTAQTAGGVASSAQTFALVYYNQFLETIAYSVVGGGSGYSAPSVSGLQFGSTALLGLGASPMAYWLDNGASYSATNPLPGSTSTQRWFAPLDQGTVTGPSSVSIIYDQQFSLAITGGAASSTQWYNRGTQASVSQPAVFGRASGTGHRVTSYAVDGGQQASLAPTLGNFTVSVAMNAPHTLSLATVAQYQVSLDATSTQGLGSITPPTISGDGYWYDSGSKVSVAIDGVWGRVSGTGTRLISYSVNGAQTQVSANGTVNVLTLSAMTSAQSVTAKTTTQFLLSTGSGQIASITPPSVSGDSGWYDSQTVINAAFNYTWGGNPGESRLNALGYSVDGGPESTVSRQGGGTFKLSVTMNQPHRIGIDSVAQYRLAYSQGADVKLSSQSPTGDGFFDSNSSTTVTTDYVWNATPKERHALTGYSLDGVSTSVARSASGTFTTPAITFSSFHSLNFESVAQYFASFAFSDSHSNAITPTSLSITERSPPAQLQVPGFSLWIDNGTSFTIASLIWEGVDVKPLSSAVYNADTASTISINARVYEATVKVVDYFGSPVTGANVAISLANGSTISGATASNGTATFRQIPLGAFAGTVTSVGVTSHVSGDASTGQTTVVKTYGSYLMFGSVGAAILGVALLMAMSMRRIVPKRNQE
jgi:hypothetical protein